MRIGSTLFLLALLAGQVSLLAQQPESELETRVYEVPWIDSVELELPEGASIDYEANNGWLTVVHSEPHFAELEERLDEIVARSRRFLYIIHERFEADQLDFSDWFLENTMDGDGTELRETVQEWAREGRATIVDTTTIACRSGQRAKTRSGEEFIYPTEPGVPGIPNQLDLSGKVEAPTVPRVASAFETRYLGVMLEVDPVIGYDDVTIDLNLAPYFTELEKLNRIQREPEGNLSAVDMPTFHMQRITTQVSLLDGRYAFLGTTRPHEASDPERTNPLILNFVRADVGKVSGWKRVK